MTFTWSPSSYRSLNLFRGSLVALCGFPLRCSGAVFVGEADYTFADICDGKHLTDIPGITYRNNDNEIFTNEARTPIANLDDLPMPAWHLYNIADYYNKKINKAMGIRALNNN